MIESMVFGFAFLAAMVFGSWLVDRAFSCRGSAFFAIAAFFYWSAILGFVFYAIVQSSAPVEACSGINNQLEQVKLAQKIMVGRRSLWQAA